ncbi:MAG: hypothetical protein WCK02_05910 [Bacteroidota bacterium]
MNTYKSDFGKMIIEDGICFVTFLAETTTLEIANILVKERLLLTQNIAYPLLSDIRLTKKITREARERLADKEAEIGVSACAIILNSKFQIIISQFFLSISQSKIPTKFFNNIEDGAKWLQKFKL